MRYTDHMTQSFPTDVFEQSWSTADARALWLSFLNPDLGAAADLEAARACSQTLAKAFQAQLVAWAAAGRLERVPHTEGRHIRWANAWNALVAGDGTAAGPASEAMVQGLENLAYHWFLDLSRVLPDPRCPDQPTLVAFRDGVANILDKGDLSHWKSISLRCAITGERLRVAFSSWAPALGTLEFDTSVRFGAPGHCRFQPLTGPAPELGVVHAPIPVPSGELWLADWIRIPAFTEATKAAETVDGEEVDIGSDLGRQTVTERHASICGVASVYAGNSSPTVFRDGTSLLVGDEEEYTSPSGERLGRIDTGLRWATLVDREVLTGLIAQKVGRDEAERQVADYALQNADDLLILQVTPGTHHLYFSGHADIFARAFRAEEVSLTGFAQPWLVLSEAPLTLLPPVAPARRPKP